MDKVDFATWLEKQPGVVGWTDSAEQNPVARWMGEGWKVYALTHIEPGGEYLRPNPTWVFDFFVAVERWQGETWLYSRMSAPILAETARRLLSELEG